MINTSYMTVEEVATHLRVSHSLVYKKIKHGELSPVLVMSRKLIRIPIDTLRKYEEKLCQPIKSDSGSGEEKTASGASSLDLVRIPSAYQLGQRFAQKQKSSAPSLSQD